MRLSLLLAQRAFCLVQQGYASGQVRCTLQLFVALLFSKFYYVLVLPPDELEFQPGPLLNEPEPHADAGASRLQLYFDCCALSVISFPAPPRPPRAAEPAPLPRVRKQSGSQRMPQSGLRTLGRHSVCIYAV